MKIYLVRHGESTANKNNINSGGQDDSPLTELGIQQAKKLAEKLKSEKFDKIFVSTQTRARQTAEPIIKNAIKNNPDTNIEFTAEIRERDMGEFERKQTGSFVKHVKKLGSKIDSYRPKNGESFQDCANRSKRFFEKIRKENHKTILIISHGSFITQTLFHLLKIPPEKRQEKHKDIHPDNTGLTILEMNENEKINLITINNTEHLKGK